MEDGTPASPPPSTPAPRVRARHPQMLLRMAQEALPEGSPPMTASLSGETRATLAAADPMDWLPIEIDVEVVEAVAERMDPERNAALLAARQREEMGSSIFHGFVATALRAFAASPVTMVKRIPDGWARVWKDAGWVSVVSIARNVAVLRVHRLPPVIIGSRAWMTAMPISLQTLYELVGARGTVECRVEDPAEGTVLCTFRWK